jgi:hypothetical protein
MSQRPAPRILGYCQLFTRMEVQSSADSAPSACTHLFHCAASSSSAVPPLSSVQLFLHQQAFIAYLEEKSSAVGSTDAVMPSAAPADPGVGRHIATCSTRTLINVG